MPQTSFSWQEYMSAWNSGNVDRILGCYADDAEVIGAQPSPIRGKDELRKSLQAYFRTFSDVNGDAEVLVASGEYVAALVHVTSRHAGVLDVGGTPVPATGKAIDDTLAIFLKLDENGKIEREWDVTNRLATLQQLGVSLPQASGAQTRRT